MYAWKHHLIGPSFGHAINQTNAISPQSETTNHGQLFPTAYQLTLDTHRSPYDCLYLALAEVVDGVMLTTDQKFYTALANDPYVCRGLWV